MIYVDLILNLTLLVSISVVSGFIEKRWAGSTRSGALLQGALFGAAAVIGMQRPLNLGPGLIFDGRSVMVSLCALYFGPRAAAVACIMTVAERIALGGAGVSVGVMVILSSTAAGLAGFSRFNKDKNPPASSYLYLFGFVVHGMMIALMLLLPGGVGPDIIRHIGVPVLLMFPAATVLVGKILSDQALAIRTMADLQKTKQLIQTRLTLMEYATNHSVAELLTKALDETSVLVSSPIGFFHFVEADQKTLSLQQWSTRTVQEFCRAENREGHNSIDNAGVWVDCIHQKKPVVHNDYASLLHRKGQPEGHARLVRQLVVPVMRDGLVVAILGLGNKPENYTEKDVETVAYLADVAWQIVEKKRTDEGLKESEALFRNLFENHAAVKMIIDPETGHIIDANRAAEKYYGWTERQLRYMKIQDINTLSPEEVVQEMKMAKSRQRVHFEFRHRLADGRIRDVAVFSSSIAMKGKELLHSIVHDITERKRAEKMLQESEENYRNLFENAPVGIFRATSQGQVLAVNKTMAEILGFRSPVDVLESYNDFQETFYVVPSQRDHLLEILKKKGHEENYEIHARTVDGRVICLSLNARIEGENDDGSFIIEGFTTDITEQRKLEEQVRQAQKMESVGRLAGGVAHDYNNMLSVILGYTELALDKVGPADPLHDDLQEILDAARRSMEVTRQLLAFARKQTIAPRVIDLNETVTGMLKMLRRLIGEDIDLVWLPGSDLWPVKMDPSQIDQILANLCVNARDAISGVGKIIIETGRVRFDDDYCKDHGGFVPGDFVQLAVSDDGCGMGKETKDMLFEPFFTTKDVGQGTGLGLATVYGIVKQNNGFLNVYSEDGKGTTFRLYLPCHKGDVVAVHKENVAVIPEGQGETILIVEDEISILNLSRAILEKQGYVVLTANTMASAMQISKENGGLIDLLITDVVMPDMNGRDLAVQLKKLHPHIKTLFMSGYTANVIAHHGVLDEEVQFIQKPFSRMDFLVKVKEALGQGNGRDSR